MRKLAVVLAIAVSALTFPAFAAKDPGSQPGVPDYSKPSLLYLMSHETEYESDFYAPGPRIFTVPHFGTISFFVMAPPIGVDETSASPKPIVDPFSLVSVPAAYTPKTYRDRWADWRAKRKHAENP